MIPALNKVDVVVLGASPTGLYVVRESARFGCRVAIADINPGCAFHSKFIASDDRFEADLESIEAWLLSFPEDVDKKPLLVPTSDVFIEFIIKKFRLLSSRFNVAQSYSGLADKLLDKKQFHDLCAEFNVDTPGVWSAPDKQSLLSLLKEIPFPCLLKPTLIHRAREYLRGEKVLIARSSDEYIELVENMPDGLGGWLVQEIIPGPESEITLFGAYMDSSGIPRQFFSARKLRQYPPGFGSASLVSSQRCKETERKSIDFLKSIGFQGICGAEFKLDSRDKKLKIIEINPRPTLWFQISYDAGKKIVSAMIADLLDRDCPEEVSQNESVKWRYALKDAYSRFFYMRPPSNFVLPPGEIPPSNGSVKSSWPVFSFDDPRPALFEPLGYLKKLWGRF
ncbi:hypothetical protein ACMG4M_11475 [Alcanivorax sp. IL3]|uniref:carboxylate--amine ligase n=1 Tax=unclassified Alcanivorax TaxID=2638842 RepID=UPI0039C09559